MPLANAIRMSPTRSAKFSVAVQDRSRCVDSQPSRPLSRSRDAPCILSRNT